MALRSTPEEQDRKFAASQNRYLADPAEGLALLARLVSVHEGLPTDVEAKLTELERLINEDFMEICEHDNLPNEAEMYGKLRQAFIDLRDLASFPALANKNVIGVGGSFSAGKSMFLNSLIGCQDLLPTGINPTTAIPTYLSHGEEDTILAITTFGNVVDMDRDAVKAICHEFYDNYKIQPKTFIRSLNVSTSNFPYRNLAFVDTPGYSKADEEQHLSLSDRDIACRELRLAQTMVWLMDITNGTIRQADLEFISQVRKELCFSQPMFVVLNKADLLVGKNLDEVLAEVEKTFQHTGIPVSGIIAYDSVEGRPLSIVGESLTEYLKKVNGQIRHCRMLDSFAEVFEAYASHNKREEVRLSSQLRFFNEFTVRTGDNLTAEEKNELTGIINDTKAKIAPLKGLVSQFESLGHKIESYVTQVLDALKVGKETPEDRGVVGKVMVRDNLILTRLRNNDSIPGKVRRNDFMAVYVDLGLGDSIPLFKDQIADVYLNPDPKLFDEGSPCTGKVLHIHHSNGEVLVAINFGVGVGQ